jgi:hypothetical protein
VAIETTIKCDVCGIRKQQANHWYRVAVQGKKFLSSSLDAEPKPWKGEKQACGPGHAQTLYQRFLSTGTLEMEMHPQAEKPEGLGNEDQDEVQAENAAGGEEGSPAAVD